MGRGVEPVSGSSAETNFVSSNGLIGETRYSRCMPHLTLEYTENTRLHIEAPKVLKNLVTRLAEHPEFKLEDIKARAVCLEHFVVGDDSPDNAFIYLRLALLEGRSAEVKSAVLERMLGELQHYFSERSLPRNTQLCVELVDIVRASYKKVTFAR